MTNSVNDMLQPPDINYHSEIAPSFWFSTSSDIVAGGTETTYTVLEWAMTELLRHPKAMKDLQTEVRGIAGGRPEITDEDLEKMKYLKSVLKETLRLYLPIPLLVPRQAIDDAKVMDFDISAGTVIITNAFAIGRHPSFWEEPDEFRPEILEFWH
nr:cytochrome P450 71A8-like [Coffea arabica]